MRPNLVINQHTFPVASINRFLDSDRLIEVNLFSENKFFKARSNNSIFCVKRQWDQSSEQGYGKKIENDFQLMVNNLLCSDGILRFQEVPVFTKLAPLTEAVLVFHWLH